MERFYTTVEQSDKLVSLGVDPQTCDMSYWKVNDNEYQIKIGKDVAIAFNQFSFRNGYIKPCWSLAALLNLIPDFEITTNTVDRYGLTYRQCYLVSGFYQVDFRTILVDGAFEMLVKLYSSK